MKYNPRKVREAVYNACHEVLSNPMPLGAKCVTDTQFDENRIRDIVSTLSNHFDLPDPKIVIHDDPDSQSAGEYNYLDHSLHFYPIANDETAIHEMAHYVLHMQGKPYAKHTTGFRKMYYQLEKIWKADQPKRLRNIFN